MLSALLLPVAHPRNPHNRSASPQAPPSFRCFPDMMSSPCPYGSAFDNVVHRLQKLSLPSRPRSPPRPSPSITLHPPPNTNTPSNGHCALESPFAYSWPEYLKEPQNEPPTIIDSFSPRPLFDLSPTSSASSDLDLSASHHSSISRRSSFDSFMTTHSRVIRVSKLLVTSLCPI